MIALPPVARVWKLLPANKEFLLFHNFALIQRCLFKTISFFTFNQIKMLAQSKLSTVSDHISKALKDNEISDEEFTLILSKINIYNQLKVDIRNKTKSKLDEATKESLIKQGKEKASEEFSTTFGAHSKVGNKAV
jgi:D-alanyl-lipoteichoic acid acyltransferase DltB (MBOAT superfamily)